MLGMVEVEVEPVVVGLIHVIGENKGANPT